ncbi:MAG: flavodoxin family protein [Bacillota bacterium]|jgi:hypothetical protein
MRVLVLNGSPRGEKSNTHAILTPFIEGLREAGAEVETLVVRDLDIGFCQGCFACWFRTPGECRQKDDMALVLEKAYASDFVVFATPLYHFGMTALLKRLLERTLPMVDPRLVKYGDRYGHPLRAAARKPGRYILISNCGFPERVHFGALVEHFRYLTGGRGPAATILVGGGEALGRTYRPGPDGPFAWFFDALRRAGREIAFHGRLSPETDELLQRPLVPDNDYAAIANASFEGALKEEREQRETS